MLPADHLDHDTAAIIFVRDFQRFITGSNPYFKNIIIKFVIFQETAQEHNRGKEHPSRQDAGRLMTNLTGKAIRRDIDVQARPTII